MEMVTAIATAMVMVVEITITTITTTAILIIIEVEDIMDMVVIIAWHRLDIMHPNLTMEDTVMVMVTAVEVDFLLPPHTSDHGDEVAQGPVH